MAGSIPKIKLNNGYEIPLFGLGTYLSGPGEVQLAVKYAIDAGYRHFDCAYFYQNESEVGEGLREKINDGTVKREELFITSKLWNTYHSEDKVVPMCRKSLENLGLDYLDLFLIHWPVAYKEGEDGLPQKPDGSMDTVDTDYMETWHGMEKCVQLGLTRSIGVSNFNSEQLDRVLKEGTIKPVNNQVECSVNINQKKLIEFCKTRDVVVTGYSPLGRPDIARTRPNAPKPALDNPKIFEIAKKYNKTPAQIVLRYLVEIGSIPIPKSVTKERIEQNINIFDFKLTMGEIKLLDEFNQNARMVSFKECQEHKYFPFGIEF